MTMSEQQIERHQLGDVLVLGAGRTGEAVARHLARLVPSRVSSVTLYGGAACAPGERTRALEELGVTVVCGTEEVAGRYDLAVASPGIPDTSDFFRSAAACAAEVIGEPELAWRERPERWVAVTGTNGKTTTTSLVTHLLREGGPRRGGGGQHRPAAGGGARRRRGGGVVCGRALELPARHHAPLPPARGGAAQRHARPPWSGTHTMEAYAAAKERAFANLGPDDLAVVSVDDDWCRAVAARCAARGLAVCRPLRGGRADGPDAAFLRDDALVVRRGGEELELARAGELRIRGRHNCENALAAGRGGALSGRRGG